MKLIYVLGIKATATRSHFWRTFIAIVTRNPLALEALGWDCFHFYYLNQHVKHVRGEFLRYLSAPSPEDVLDRVARRSDRPRAPVGA